MSSASATVATLAVTAASLALASSPAGAVAMCRGMPVTHTAEAGVLLVTGDGDDVVLGSTGDDLIDTGDGNDTVCGRAGDDTITTGPGNDDGSGGPGNDRVYGGDGNDIISGGPGYDSVAGEHGDDRVSGNADDDLVSGGTGDDELFGGRGDDRLVGYQGDDLLVGQPGDDRLDGQRGKDRLIGGTGDDVIEDEYGRGEAHGNAGADTIEALGRLAGGGGPDVLIGSPFNDQIFGGRGHDTIEGGGGPDRIFGGPGWADIDGGDGDDDIRAGSGHGSSEIVVDGGYGDDRIEARAFAGTTNGGIGNDTILADGVVYGGAHDDLIVAWSSPANYVDGGGGNDLIVVRSARIVHGSDGDDSIVPFNDDTPSFEAKGWWGDDLVVGSRFAPNRLHGGDDDDFINTWGGSGNRAWGGEGDDDLFGTPYGVDLLDGLSGTDTCGGGLYNDTDANVVYIWATDYVQDDILNCERYYPRDVQNHYDDSRLRSRIRSAFSPRSGWQAAPALLLRLERSALRAFDLR